jgi:hypothetical protein
LVGELVRDEFGVEHPVVAMQQPSEEFGRLRRAYMDLLGGRAIRYERWMRALQNGLARVVEVDPSREGAIDEIRDRLDDEQDAAGGAVVLCGWSDGVPSFRFKLDDLQRFDTIDLLTADAAVEALARFEPVPEGEEQDAGAEEAAAPEVDPNDAGGEPNGVSAPPPRAEERVQPAVPEPSAPTGGGGEEGS